VTSTTAEVVVADGVVVLTGKDVSFANLGTAVKRLVDLLKEGDSLKLSAARVVQAISRQELYREAGVETMAAFYPLLLAQTASVGWQAERTVKMWLAFTNLYLDVLKLDEAKAMKANSHLHSLYALAAVDRKSGELADATEKPGKLGAGDFEAIVLVITGLVTAPKGADKQTGLDATQTYGLLVNAGVSADHLKTYEEKVGGAPYLPVSGWTVADTRAVIDLLKGKDEPVKVSQVWEVERLDEETVWLSAIYWTVDGVEIDRVSRSGTQYPLATFKAISKGDKVVDLSEGTPDDEDDGYSDDE
jgi:hypothetical protein